MKKILGILSLSLALSGCIKPEQHNEYSFEDCQDYRKIYGRKYIAKHENGTPVVIEFEAQSSTLNWKVANKYFSNYDVKCNQISFSHIGGTKMALDTDTMAAEQYFLRLFRDVKFKYIIQDNGLVLINTFDVNSEGISNTIFFKEIAKYRDDYHYDYEEENDDDEDYKETKKVRKRAKKQKEQSRVKIQVK